MKKVKRLLYIFVALFVLAACGDVESMGEPQARVPRIEVEETDYYVQITDENLDGVAFVYRWLDMEVADEYLITLSREGESPDEGTVVIDIADKSILTYNGVRELLFTNKELLQYLADLGVQPVAGLKKNLDITLSAVDAQGLSIISDASKASMTSTVHILIDEHINLSN